MAKVYSFSVCNGDTIVEDIEKLLIGLNTRSEVIVKALHDFKKNRTGVDGKPFLPEWEIWKKFIHEIKDSELEQLLKEVKHLTTLTDFEKQWRTGVLREGIDY